MIALDDSAVPEPEPNEPWEYIEFNDEDPEGGHAQPTYAEIVATSA